jgi:hypothetical protein
MNLLCKLNRHKYLSVLRTYDLFVTNWTDTGEKSYWQVHFLKCKHCGSRSFYTDWWGSGVHKGIDKAKHSWLDDGYIADWIRNPQRETPKQPDPQPKTRLTTSEKIDKLLLKALDTASENEAINCLKMARKAYNAKG